MPLYNLWGASDLDIEIAKDAFPSDEWLKDQDELFDHPQHGWFNSVYENKRLHYRKNIPTGNKNVNNVRAIVVWHHGICGQSGFGMKIGEDRYTDQALRIRQMGEAGIAVYSFDGLGHGFSEGTRFAIPDGEWQIYRDDLVAFCRMASNDFDVPLFVSGDSFGGCLALHAAHYFQDNDAERPARFVGCCLNCPSIEADLPPKPVELFLRYCLAPFFPEWTPFFMPHPITSERVWKDPEAMEYFSDPGKTHGLSRGGVPFCLGTAVGLLTSLQEAQRVSHLFRLPFHVSHGDQDHGVMLSGSQHLYNNSQTPATKKSLNVVIGGYHGLFSQTDAKDILDHEIKWIEERIEENETK
mmetsp:Transcript_36906/g.79683  ORF Transcript_36906/g.79683 Transcript_36906/m.79683 type:complete len:354 (-) Transcript_36906:332-1393(-)